MKNIRFSILLIWFVAFISTLHTSAQDSPQWHLPEGVTARLGKGEIRDIAYSPSGTRLAVASAIGIWLYDTETYQEIALFTRHGHNASSVAFSPDGSKIASSGNREIHLWDAETGIFLRTFIGHTAWVNNVAFSPDGNTIASGSFDETIRLWDVETGTLLKTLIGHASRVLMFSPNGSKIASGSDHRIRLWDVETGTLLKTLIGHTGSVSSIAFRPDGNTIVQ